MAAQDGSAPSSARLAAAMADPAFYEHRPERVELHETHISWVFVAGELAYKVKKPLRLPFLDYGTLRRRRLMCEQEVELNRRLAPEIYLGVRSVLADGDDFRLAGPEASGAIEYAVEMRAFPPELELDRLLASGAAGEAELAAVAALLARFHREAPIPEDPGRAVESLLAALAENHETLRAHAGSAIAEPRLEAAERFTATFLAAGGLAELERRANEGAVRDGHGDLRAEHVLLTDPIQIYDCIEFDPRLRELDVAADLAFLVMDVERIAGRDASLGLESAYRAAGGDPGPPRLLAFLAAYRAWVRAKVSLLSPDRGRGAERAAALHALGHRFAWRARPPSVVWVCGVAASGKSTLAEALAEASGLPVVAADPTRKRLAGLAPDERASPEHYRPEFSRRTYRELGRLASAELERGGGVIVDATGRVRADRDALRTGLGETGAPLLFARCSAPREVLIERARARESDPGRVSDAGVDVVIDQLDRFERLEEVEAADRVEVATDRPLDDQLAAVEALIDRVRPA